MADKLTFERVNFGYDQTPIVENLSLDVKKGEFVSLVGPSGVGKSTLFQLANGLLQPQTGQILLNGKVTCDRLGKVAYMPQQDLLMPWRTVVENAALPLEIQGIPSKAAREQVLEQLPLFGLIEYADAYPRQLSGGMRQRVSLLRTTLTGADLLLLDEPFSALDGITRMEMQEWLLRLWSQIGSTVVMITHDLEEAILLSDRVLVIKEKPIRTVTEIPVPTERCVRGSSRHEASTLLLRERIWRELQSRTDESSHRGGVAT
ncbi:ABC transporter ATP-binding protein [Brevibacillus ginsengisoli]|uniref:ABC transporter ATP-binding protein n=1 Tax=Brevibacillus ginsengisoli TaxID=363854 RepID=UPI003CF24A1F